VHEVEQVRVRARLEQHGVELPVELGERVRVEVVEQAAHPLVDLRGLRERVRAEQGSGQRGGRAFDESERLHGVGVLALIHEGHAGADVALEGHEPLGLQAADRLAHRDHTHPQLLGDRTEDQAVAGTVGVRRDARADPGVRLLRLAGALDRAHFRSAPVPVACS